MSASTQSSQKPQEDSSSMEHQSTSTGGTTDQEIAKDLVVLHVLTSGRQNEDLGADETPLCSLVIAIYRPSLKQMIAMREIKVNPVVPWLILEEDENAEEVSPHQDTKRKKHERDGFERAFEEIDEFLREHSLIEDDVTAGSAKRFCLVTENAFPLRSVVHAEAGVKCVQLAKYAYLFEYFDLQKQFAQFYLTTLLPLHAMLQCLDLPSNCATSSTEFNVSRCEDLIQVAHRMTEDGFEWKVELTEHIDPFYYPGIIRQTDFVPNNLCVRARGLPWQATDAEISQFFHGLNIARGGIAVILSRKGRRNGEAIIQFTDEEQRNLALRKNYHHMGQRYIELYTTLGAEFVMVAGGECEQAIEFLQQLTRPGQTLVRLRGLPYTASHQQILDFFSPPNEQRDDDEITRDYYSSEEEQSEEEIKVNVEFGANGILFVNYYDGKSTGDAFVLFASEREAELALMKHKCNIGSRYIELFKSTPAEVNQVMNCMMYPPASTQQSHAATFSANSTASSGDSAAFSAASAVAAASSSRLHSNGGIADTANQLLNNLFMSSSLLSSAMLSVDPQNPNHSHAHKQHANHPRSHSPHHQHRHHHPSQHHNQHSPFNYIDRLMMSGILSPGGTLSNAQTAQTALQLLGISNLTESSPALQPPFESSPFDSNLLNLADDKTAAKKQRNTPGTATKHSEDEKPYLQIKGMPLEVTVADVLKFLGSHSKNIVLQGVHLVYNRAGQSAGEAIVQMVSEKAAQAAMDDKQNSQFYSALYPEKCDQSAAGTSAPEKPKKRSKQHDVNTANTNKKDGENVCSPPYLMQNVSISLCSSKEIDKFISLPGEIRMPLAFPFASAMQAQQQKLAQKDDPNALAGNATAYAATANLPTTQLNCITAGTINNNVAHNNAGTGADGAAAVHTNPFPILVPFYFGSLPALSADTFTFPTSQLSSASTVLAKGLPADAMLEEILNIFESMLVTGIVPDVKVGVNSAGQTTGEAFITFPTREDATRAVHECNHRTMRQTHAIKLVLLGSGGTAGSTAGGGSDKKSSTTATTAAAVA